MCVLIVNPAENSSRGINLRIDNIPLYSVCSISLNNKIPRSLEFCDATSGESTSKPARGGENDIILNLQIVSELMSIIIDIQQNNDTDSILEKIIDSEEIYKLIIKMFMTEYGYVRYDYDEEHCNGNFHPLNHLDVNFSSNAQYKLGLENRINLDTFIDILDLKTNCYFFNKD